MTTCDAIVRHIYLSEAHNYRGHHGRPPGAHSVVEVGAAKCVAGRGLEGDRYFDHEADYRGQITFFSWEVYQGLRQKLGVYDRPPSVFRRNVLVEEIDLNSLINVRFELQGILFEGTEECRPCYWMDQAFAPGAEVAMAGSGGLRARILTTGVLRVTHNVPALSVRKLCGG